MGGHTPPDKFSVFMPHKVINEAVYATQAVSEYSTQVSLLQLCMCVIARIKFQGMDIPCAPLLSKRNPARANMHKCLSMCNYIDYMYQHLSVLNVNC